MLFSLLSLSFLFFSSPPLFPSLLLFQELSLPLLSLLSIFNASAAFKSFVATRFCSGVSAKREKSPCVPDKSCKVQTKSSSMKQFFAMVFLIFMALFGAAMTPEARRSFEAFESRAENGDPEAQYRLSAILERGFDTIPADSVRSLSLLRRHPQGMPPP